MGGHRRQLGLRAESLARGGVVLAMERPLGESGCLALNASSSGSSPNWISSDILGDVKIWLDIIGDLWRLRISLRFSYKHILKKIS